MKNTTRFVAAAAVSVTALLAAAGPHAAHAQTDPIVAPAAAAPVAATPSVKPVPALKLDHMLARDAAAQISKATDATVLTDSTVSLVPVTLSTVGGPLPQVLKQITGVMPKGVVVRVIMLPAFLPKAAPPSGDDLAALYTSQENLVVPVMGGKAERDANTVNVLGKLLPSDKAAPIIAALDLRPVYLLTNPNADNNPIVRSAQMQAESMRLWQSMTPAQRTQAANQQFDALMNMDSPSRQAMFAMFGQQAQTMQAKIMSMPQAQRDQFIHDVTTGMGLPTPPAGGGGGAGKQ